MAARGRAPGRAPGDAEQATSTISVLKGPNLRVVSEKLSNLKEQVYSDPRPKEYFDRFHERARRRGPTFVYELVRVVSSLYAYTALRARASGAERVPERGPVILAPNHFSYMDHFLIGIFIRRKVRFMAKSQLFKPGAQWVYMQGGVFPVRRGTRDEEAFVTAEAILKGGGAIAMYPEGGRSRTGNLADRVRPGIGRLVLDSGAPVVPIAIHGSAKIRNWKRLRFPQVRVSFGEPMRFAPEPNAPRERQQEIADAIFAQIRALYDGAGARPPASAPDAPANGVPEDVLQ
jgi:1-acyl-sn-glycerol-3-phosphate acyltransferase